jgi:4-hydroxybenzoate polyprenyltransferase
MKIVGILVVVLLLAFGGLYAVAHHAITSKADAEYSELAPVSASFSRFKSTEKHGLATFWKLHYAKESKRAPSVAVWYFRPFGTVEFEGGKR